jgi:hypothetical protein
MRYHRSVRHDPALRYDALGEARVDGVEALLMLRCLFHHCH